jgi:hypothetical protein
MAIVQKVAPADLQNYFGWSHPISDVPPDKSTAIAIEGFGKAAVSAVKAYEDYKTMDIQEQVRDTTYKRRDQEIEELTQIKEGLRTKGATTGDVEDVSPNPPSVDKVSSYSPESTESALNIRYGSTNTTQSAAAPTVSSTRAYAQAGPDEPVPDEVSSLPDMLEARKASLDQNKISRTQFMMAMYKDAQRLRAENPRFVDKIDAEFSRVLGTDPANATMAGLVRDINSMVAQTQRADPVLQDLRWANKQGFPNADVYMRKYQKGEIGADEVNEFINKGAVHFYQQRLKEGTARSSEIDVKDRERNSTERLRAQGGYIATNYFKSMNVEAGVNTPEQMLDLVVKVQSGALDVKSEEVVALGGAIRAAKVRAYEEMIKFSRMVPEGGGRSIEQDIGPGKVKEEALAALGLFDEVEKLITDKQIGAAFMAQNIAEAIGSQGHLDLLRDQKMGPHARMLQSMRKTIGDNYLGQFAQRHLTRGTKFTSGINAWITANENAALAPVDLRRQSGLESLKEGVDRSKRAGIQDPKVYESLIDITKEITNPELKGPNGDTVKVNAAKWAFDPVKNKGLFQKFTKDSINDDGSITPGAFRAFQRLTTSTMAQEINRLEGTPQGRGLKQMYIDFVQKTAGVDLLRSEFNTLDSFFNDPNLRVAYNKGSGQFEVHYVPVSRGSVIDALRLSRQPVDILRASPEDLRTIPSTARGTIDAARDTFFRVNMGFASLKSVADAMGLDANSFALQTMVASRQRGDLPRKLDEQLEKSIINSTGTSIKGDKQGGETKKVKTESYKKPPE